MYFCFLHNENLLCSIVHISTHKEHRGNMVATQAVEWLRILEFLLTLSTDKRKYH